MSNSTLIARLDRWQRYATIAGVAGILVCIIAAFFARAEVFQAYWFAWVYWAGLSLGALSLLMLVFLTRGAWSNAVQRPVEAAATTIPIMGLLLIPAFFSMGDIFEWARPGAFAEHHWPHKERYLTVGWFALRTVIVFVVVSAIMASLRYFGWLEEQRTRFLRPSAYLGGVSGLGMVIYSACMLFATTDWVMSLQPEWFSTMFSVIFMTSGFLAALALSIGVMTLVNRGEPISGFLSTKQFHDLGNLLLAFVIFWMYVSFSQFLLIWSGNLPREIVWYLKRRSGGWEYVALMLAIFQFAAPFALLLSRAAKRHPQTLGVIAWLVFAASVLNVYWMVIPTFRHGAGDGFWLSAIAFVGIGGIWTAVFLWLLKRRPLLPLVALQPEEHHG
ncbi:hypothetical protein ACXR0O_21540 [Verrucomicrobiota bacterium sgz303538]